MANPTDYTSEIDKLRLKLDYEKYDDDNSYKQSYSQDEEIQPIAQKPNGIILPELDISRLSNIVINPNAPKIATDSTDKATGPFGSINGKGSGLEANAGGIAQYAMQNVNMFSNTAQSEKEGWSNIGSNTLGGAALGMQVAGPVGAAIGGGIGLLTSTIDMIGDTKKRNIETRDKFDLNHQLLQDKRKQDYNIKTGEGNIEKLAKLKKAQLNYLNLDI